MTREEAIKKVENSILNDVPLSTAVKSADMHIRVIEALGLLKFDEPKKQIEWINGIGSRCWFSEGYNPNEEANIIHRDWRKVEPKQEQFITAEQIIVNCFESVSAPNPSTRAKELINWLKRKGYEIVNIKAYDIKRQNAENLLQSVPLRDLQVVHRFRDKNGLEYHVGDVYLGPKIDLKRE